jgi:hypothetical protein
MLLQYFNSEIILQKIYRSGFIRIMNSQIPWLFHEFYRYFQKFPEKLLMSKYTNEDKKSTKINWAKMQCRYFIQFCYWKHLLFFCAPFWNFFFLLIKNLDVKILLDFVSKCVHFFFECSIEVCNFPEKR